MKNYERILAGGRDALIDLLGMDSCSRCSRNGETNCEGFNCSDGQAEWLDADYDLTAELKDIYATLQSSIDYTVTYEQMEKDMAWASKRLRELISVLEADV